MAPNLKGEGRFIYYINGIRGTSKDEHADSNTNDPIKIIFFIIKTPGCNSDDYGCFSTSSTTFSKLRELGFVNELKLEWKFPFLSISTL